ncbi:hypothetical protein T492DRAFT_849765 [Pavlovales sp. CCMP2436]|nr:hypothetical protein T492DRAFT_849765 [Pavlovales sp. CCMP2436]
MPVWASQSISQLPSRTGLGNFAISANILKICTLVATETAVDFWTAATACFESRYSHASIDYVDFFTRANAADNENQHAKVALFERVLQLSLDRLNRDGKLRERVSSELLAPLLELVLPLIEWSVDIGELKS